MIRAYKFLLRPTARQAAALGEMLRDHCSLYNGALQERRDAYRHVSKTTVRYGDQSAQLKEIRAFDPDHLTRTLRRGLAHIQRHPELLDGCLSETGLPLAPGHPKAIRKGQ